MSWYRSGSIALTNGSTAVVGTGTDFVAGAAVGESVVAPDGKVYEIAAVVSATSLTLGSNYLGTTASGQPYAIAPTQSYIRDLAGQAAALINTYSGLVTNAAAGKFPDGTLSVPSIRFTTDDNTGINHLTSDSFDLVTNGVSRLNVSNSGLSGDATGLSNTIAPQTVAATSKTTPADADLIPLVDSAASNVLKKLTWANLKATLLNWLQGTVLPAPGPIGSVTPSTGAFTTLSATGQIRAKGGVSTNETGPALGYSGANVSLIGAWGGGGATRGIQSFYLSDQAGSNGNEYMRLTDTGLAVTGTGSFTGQLSTTGSTLGVVPSSGVSEIILGNNVSAGYSRIFMKGNSSQYNWKFANSDLVGDSLEFTPSTAAAGSTYTTPVMTISRTAVAVTGTLSATGVGDVAVFGSVARKVYIAPDSLGVALLSGAAQTGSGIYIDAANNAVQLWTNSVAKTTLDAAGNLGLGVTPSAWGANFKAMQFNGLYGGAVSTSSASNTSTNLSHCAYHNGTNWTYGATGFGAARYEIDGPSGGATHKWFTAPSGTAGNTITFTQALTLDALGNLLVGMTSATASSAKTIHMANSTVPTANPTGGGVLYVESGALKYRGSSGTITTLAAA